MKLKEIFIFIKDLVTTISNIIALPVKIVAIIPLITASIGYIFKIKFTIDLYLFSLIIFVSSALPIIFILLIPRTRLYLYSNNAFKHWEKLKSSIIKYHNSQDEYKKETLENIYIKNKYILLNLCTEHQDKILGMLAKQKPSANNFAPPIFFNFKSVFSSNTLKNWKSSSSRDPTHESLDCYDIIAFIIQKNN